MNGDDDESNRRSEICMATDDGVQYENRNVMMNYQNHNIRG